MIIKKKDLNNMFKAYVAVLYILYSLERIGQTLSDEFDNYSESALRK